MKNKLSDLNDHLFAQLERLGDEELSPQDIEHEVSRAEAIVKVSDQIINNAALKIQAAKILADTGLPPDRLLPLLEEGKR